ncbi:MAG: 50S ribosomal protein L25/general stress protein Ctc [Rickettsiales bacterium]|nr:50S ribosomal protein L25/general stress protein Ctc [Rickettsiales bacterium]
MTGVVLKAEKREKLGSIASKKIKQAGKIPAVIYQAGGNVNVAIDAREFEMEYFKGNAKTSVIELEISGKKTKVIAHKIDLDPVSDRPTHVDFLNCEESKTVKAQPKLKFINQDKSPGLKKGGFLHIVLRKVAVICDSVNNIPTVIEINVGAMQVGQKIRGKDLVLPAGVSLAKNDSFLVASIIGRASKSEEETAAAASATPAAGAAAPAAGAPAAAGAKAATPAAAKADKK